MRALYVEWLDPTAGGDWLTIKEINLQFKPIKSVGWLIKEDKLAVLISLNWDEEEDKICEFIKIPKDLITKRKWIRL